MKFTALLFLLTLLSLGCTKDSTTPPPGPNAVVLHQGMDCGDTYIVKFNSNVQGLPSPNVNNTYYAIDLPAAFKVDSLEVYLEYRLPNNDEFMVCSTMGPGYTQIVITHVE